MKGNKNIRSISEKCDASDSQEVYLQRCRFAVGGQPPPDSDPTVGVSSPLLVNDGVPSQRDDDSESESLIGSGYDQNLVESQAIRFVSPPETEDTVDLEEDEAVDPTVEIVAEKKQSDVLVDSKVVESSSSGNRRDRGNKLKIPLRDVVKAIVMNSRNTEEEAEYKEIDKMSCVQILLQKGFKF